MVCKCGYQNRKDAVVCRACGRELKKGPGKLPVILLVAALVVAVSALAFILLKGAPAKKPQPSSVTISNFTQTPAKPTQTAHTHSWREATCSSPKTCTTCGTTQGSTLAHTWIAATAQKPQTCMYCGTTQGTPVSGSVANPLANLRVGDTFTFGSFDQDGNSANGSEGIVWLVLHQENGKLLAISKYGLDCQRYHSYNTDVTWAICSVRTWLNNTFYASAFDNKTQNQIISTTVESGAGQDKVFLLSLEELNSYMTDSNDRICQATTRAVNNNAYVNTSTGGSWWLLRTPGENNKYVMSVNSDGSIDYDGGTVAADRGVVRPAIWISTN